MNTNLPETDAPHSKLDSWIERWRYLIGVATLFTALLYFVGRRYTETYFTAIGVPSTSLELSFADYAYSGANPIRLVIVILFTLVGIGLIRVLLAEQGKPVIENNYKINPKHEKLSKFFNYMHRWSARLFFAYITLLFVVYSFSLPIITLIEIFGDKPDPTEPPMLAYVSIILLMFTVGWAVTAFFNKKTISMIVRFRIIRNFYIWGGIITFLLLPYLGAGAYGIFEGVIDIREQNIGNNFDTVTLVAYQSLDVTIAWEKTPDGFYRTTGKLYLLTTNDESLFIKLNDKASQTIVIPKDQLYSFTISKD